MNELKKIEDDLQSWIIFQNGITGVLAFSFSLACLSMPDPVSFLSSFASIFMVVTLSMMNAPKLSSTYQLLRDKPNKTKREREIYEYASTKFLSNFKYLPFNIGFFMLVITWLYTGLPFFLSRFIT